MQVDEAREKCLETGAQLMFDILMATRIFHEPEAYFPREPWRANEALKRHLNDALTNAKDSMKHCDPEHDSTLVELITDALKHQKEQDGSKLNIDLDHARRALIGR